MSRVIKRPPNGWDRRPNAHFGDWLFLVFLMFCSAQFFAWASAALDVIISGFGGG